MADEHTKEEKRLLNIKATFERLYTTDDGKEALEFLKQVTGYKFPLPLAKLEVAEGARRTVCLISILSEDANPKAFLRYCLEQLTDGKFLQ